MLLAWGWFGIEGFLRDSGYYGVVWSDFERFWVFERKVVHVGGFGGLLTTNAALTMTKLTLAKYNSGSDSNSSGRILG